MEHSMELPQQIKDGTTIQQFHFWVVIRRKRKQQFNIYIYIYIFALNNKGTNQRSQFPSHAKYRVKICNTKKKELD